MGIQLLAFGTKLKVDLGAGFVDVPGLIDVPGGPLSGAADEIDVTNHDSPNSVEEVLLGIIRTGEIAATMHYNPQNTVHKQLIADQLAKTERNWKLVMVDAGASEWAFAARVKGFSFDSPVNGAYQATLTLKPSGSPTAPA